MKHDIKVPTVGESITEVTIAQWLKKDGEFVEADDLICEIESDKASFEIPAEHSGILKVLAHEGDTIEVGSSIAQVDSDGAASSKSQESESRTKAAKVEEKTPASESNEQQASKSKHLPSDGTGATHKVEIPAVGESITEVILAQWLKKDGEQVSADDLLCEIESDKASFEIPAEQGGTLKTLVKEGETIAVGTVIAEITGDGQAVSSSASTEDKSEAASVPSSGALADGNSKSKMTPVAANILKEAGIPVEQVAGSGPSGSITKDDAQKAVQNLKKQSPEAPAKTDTAKTSEPDKPAVKAQPAATAGAREVRQERMSTLRKTIAKRLVAAKNETAMLTTFNEVDMTAIKTLRAKYKEMFKEKHEIGLGFMSFFSKACCLALKEWPAVNAQIDGDHIIYHDFCDISIAVSTPRGLVVPVIRNADSLSLADIEREVVRLATKARDNKLTIEEMTGGTFTITNGGVFGSLMSTPIINAPQSAILGMHKIEDRPMVIGGEVVVRPMMYVALSYDHRIIDGRESVSFLVRVKEFLEDPARMFLEV